MCSHQFLGKWNKLAQPHRHFHPNLVCQTLKWEENLQPSSHEKWVITSMTSSHCVNVFYSPLPRRQYEKAALYQEFCLHTISWNIHTIIAYNPHLFIIIMYTVKLRKRLRNSPMLYYIHLVPLPSHLIASSMQILTGKISLQVWQGRFHYRCDKEDFITGVTRKISLHYSAWPGRFQYMLWCSGDRE